MAVPKKRTTSASRGQRRSHQALARPNLIMTSGQALPHRLIKAAKLGLIKKD